LRRHEVSLAAFDPVDNAITPLRLILAVTVLLSHSYVIGGYGVEPLVAESGGTMSVGIVAVLAFFVLSGFLLARSRERTLVVPFLRNRALRIFPAYWLSLIFVVVIAGPIGATMTGVRLDGVESTAYLLPRLVFIPETSETQLRAAFGGAVINGSLWTLGIECLCYLCLAVIPARLVRPVVTGELALLLMLWIGVPTMRGPDTGLLLAFVAGAAAWGYRSRIVMSPLGVVVAALVLVLGVGLGSYPVVVVGIGYLALAASWLPLRSRRDLSYGVYVLAYPTQTLIAMTAIRGLGQALFVATSLLIVLPLALISWTFVERPAIGLRHRFGRARHRPDSESPAGHPAVEASDAARAVSL
jgi:peptidoglycan/LPS O-acetylase OafA/YrhL